MVLVSLPGAARVRPAGVRHARRLVSGLFCESLSVAGIGRTGGIVPLRERVNGAASGRAQPGRQPSTTPVVASCEVRTVTPYRLVCPSLGPTGTSSVPTWA